MKRRGILLLVTSLLVLVGSVAGAHNPNYECLGGGWNHEHGTDGPDNMDLILGKGCMDGFAGNDTITGDDSTDQIFGRNGADELRGHDAQDVVVGGPGDDALYGGQGMDIIYDGPGSDEVFGGTGEHDWWHKCEDGEPDTSQGIEHTTAASAENCDGLQ